MLPVPNSISSKILVLVVAGEINKFNKTSEDLEQEENEKYLKELQGKL